MERTGRSEAISRFFERDGGWLVTLDELKALMRAKRDGRSAYDELAELCAQALAVELPSSSNGSESP